MIVSVEAQGLAEAWEQSLIQLYEKGMQISTEYDKQGDEPSLDAPAVIMVKDPLSEPVIHLDFPGGPADLQEYVMEVRDGIKDHWVRNPNDPNDHRWQYTYHERMFQYSVNQPRNKSELVINQWNIVLNKLLETPHTRRAQMVLWKPWEDPYIDDPCCMQSLWFRIVGNKLHMHVRFRSNDAYQAAFMNMFALIQVQMKMASELTERKGYLIDVGPYVHMVDSYHIYGQVLPMFRERFLRNLKSRTFEQRTAKYEDWKDMMDEAIPAIEQKANRA